MKSRLIILFAIVVVLAAVSIAHRATSAEILRWVDGRHTISITDEPCTDPEAKQAVKDIGEDPAKWHRAVARSPSVEIEACVAENADGDYLYAAENGVAAIIGKESFKRPLLPGRVRT